jgi:sugar phosphate isomerase/epimerase
MAPKAERPRISCVSWCFHSLAGGIDPSEAIETIGQLGFEGVELILQGRKDAADFWTAAKLGSIRGLLDKYKLQVPQFAVFQPVVEELTSTRPEERQVALDRFEAGCRIAKALGSPIVNIVAPWPRELTGPFYYLPRYFEVADAKPGQTYHLDMAAGFDWDKIWEAFVEAMKGCLARAKAHGLKFTVENHTHTLAYDSIAFLRLWDAIADEDLGFNLDMGWVALQRIYPPVAVHQAGRHLMNVHMRDIDGLMRLFVHVGEGVMDFRAIAEALTAVGFRGFLSLEQDGLPGDMKATCARYVAMMKELLA